jgi:hypothetical protein
MHHFSDRGRAVPVRDWKSFWNPLRLAALTSPVRDSTSAGDHILRPRRRNDVPNFKAGDRVCVRSAAEILSTLDMSGRLDGTPFLNGMMPLIGAVGTVSAVVPSAVVVLEFTPNMPRSEWKAEWLVLDGSAPVLAPRAEEAARKRLASLAADYRQR